ncbi:MAG TPA: serine hydrolase [Pseudolabrys sp.]|nr:serine hydrolase [Pseudolabrys sp.]
MMQGFPPKPEAQVTLANWRSPPFHVWGFQHVREIVPSADIPNAPNAVWQLPSRPDDLSRITFEHKGKRFDFESFLRGTDTDGIVILHRGGVVHEAYAHGMTRHTPHILMSVSKSLLGIIAGILIEKGVLDLDRGVADVIPELGDTAFAGATVGDLLDMRAGIHFDEDYLATSGMIVDYRKSHGWNPREPGDPLSDMRSFFRNFKQSDGPHGGRFRYVSPNTDLLGWIIERVTNTRYADLVSTQLWQPMGAERSAYITVDRLGAPRCAGGVCATAMDLARIGQLIVQSGRRDGTAVIPVSWIDEITEHGDTEAWDHGDFAGYFPNLSMHYRHKWYVVRGVRPLLFALGVHGQYLFVDRTRQVVVAKLSSQELPLDSELILLTLAGVEAIRAQLD